MMIKLFDLRLVDLLQEQDRLHDESAASVVFNTTGRRFEMALR